MTTIYCAADVQTTHDHFSRLTAARRKRTAMLGQWRMILGLDSTDRPVMETSRVVGFRCGKPHHLHPGWRYEHRTRTLRPDRRTNEGLLASAALREIPSGRTGGHPQDLPWPGGMPSTVMYRQRPPGGGSPRWHIGTPTASLYGTRLLITWDYMPPEHAQHIRLGLWEDVTNEWKLLSLLRPRTPLRKEDL
ncbi:hypothetical protein NE857_09350 [Nocardiopsis exhalans]|uniref:Uncharacterized protein n=1 Tax=Nocardiopsis exhalans TaxID=163604 RepID=A0ABY5DCN3_9ACTN|nr:hypothetical protein [Nocardiopsis exhalans]USY21787.1 hypothetical protein NE857_09350 [Nocardiopsis exhalans]